MMPRVVFLKAHVSGYTKKDGTYVAPHEDKRAAKKHDVPAAAAALQKFVSEAKSKYGDEVRLGKLRWPRDVVEERDRLLGEVKRQAAIRDAEDSSPGSSSNSSSVEKKKKLSMSSRERLKRAKELGFDVSRVWYHGTSGDFDSFDSGREGSVSSGVGVGIWLTTEKTYAFEYAENAAGKHGGEPNVMELFVNYGKKLTVKLEQRGNTIVSVVNGSEMSFDDNASAIKYAKANGYDSVEFPNGSFTDEPALVVFDGARIRKTDAAFDPDGHEDGDLMKSSESRIIFAKANVKGHHRGKSWVKPYTTKTPAAKQKIQAPQLGLFGGHKPAHSGQKAPPVAYHPQLDHNGQPVAIHAPHKPSADDTWSSPDLAATFVPGGPVPAELNGVPFVSWADAPTSTDEWEHVEGQNPDIDEPDLELAHGKHAGAGVVIEEPDGRVWLVAPTNAFGGYKASFPKGTAEMELSLQANAIKEAYEESGLQVEITGFLMDVERSTSVARYYTARRVGGTPADAGWESQAVHLVPREQLYQFLNNPNDHGLAEALGAGPAPKKPEPPPSKGGSLFDF